MRDGFFLSAFFSGGAEDACVDGRGFRAVVSGSGFRAPGSGSGFRVVSGRGFRPVVNLMGPEGLGVADVDGTGVCTFRDGTCTLSLTIRDSGAEEVWLGAGECDNLGFFALCGAGDGPGDCRFFELDGAGDDPGDCLDAE